MVRVSGHFRPTPRHFTFGSWHQFLWYIRRHTYVRLLLIVGVALVIFGDFTAPDFSQYFHGTKSKTTEVRSRTDQQTLKRSGLPKTTNGTSIQGGESHAKGVNFTKANLTQETTTISPKRQE